MTVKIRLARTGRKNVSRFRIVAIDSHKKRDGRFLEILGSYNPQQNPKQFVINTERVAYWFEKGAQPSRRPEKRFDSREYEPRTSARP